MVVRIQGENIPMNKRAEIALTVIFGIGRSRARKILLQNNIQNKKIEDLTEEEINKIRYCIERGGSDDFKTAGALRTQIFNDIKCIISPYLATHTLNQLLQFLSLENTYTLSIERHLSELEEHNRNLTYEFLYKIFLFADFFWKGKIPEKLKNIFFVFNREHLIYNTDIDQQIYSILETKYNEYINNPESKYYILLKFTKGIKITYISEMLSKILLYKQNELINHDFGILLLRELIIPHEYLAKKIICMI